MAAKEAQIKITLSKGAFVAGLRDVEDETKKSGKRMQSTLSSALGAGLGKAKDSLKGSFTNLTQGLKTALTLGGAVSIGAFVHEAMELEEVSGRVAEKLRSITHGAVGMHEPLQTATRAAHEFKTTTESMLDAYEELLDATGDPVFSNDSLKAVATFQNAFRLTGRDAAGIVATLHEKLGANVDQIMDEYGPALRDATAVGGMKMDDFVQSGGNMLKILGATGMAGRKGFGILAGMINESDDAGGDFNSRLSSLGMILTKLHSPKVLDKLTKDLRITKGELSSSEDSVTNLQKILAKPGGFKMLQGMFGKNAETATLFASMTKPFVDSLNETHGKVKDNKERLAIAGEEFRKSLEAMQKTTNTRADVEAAAARTTETAHAKFALAIDRMKAKFADERMLHAIEQLADKLPAFAEAFGKLMDFVLAHPVAAAAAVPAMQAGGAASAGIVTTLAAAAAKKVLGGGAAATAAEGVGTTGGVVAGGGLTGGTVVATGGVATAATIGAAVLGAGLGFVGLAAHGANKQAGEMRDTADAADVLAGKARSGEDITRAMQTIQRRRFEVSQASEGGAFDSLAQRYGARSEKSIKAETLQRLDDALSRLAEKAALAANRSDELARSAQRVNTTRGPMPQPPIAPGSAGQ